VGENNAKWLLNLTTGSPLGRSNT